MRTDVYIIKSVVGDKNFDSFEKDILFDDSLFNFYIIKLKDKKYSGLPIEWNIAILKQFEKKLNHDAISEILHDLGNFFDNITLKMKRPLLVVSSSEQIDLNKNFHYEDKEIFFIDNIQLEVSISEPYQIGNTVFIHALKNKLDKKKLSLYLVKPYAPNKAVQGWQFFGREKELDKLVNADENIFIVSSRKLGKTSILLETERILAEKGEKVYSLNVQNCEGSHAVAETIARKLSAKQLYRARIDKERLRKDYFESILSQFISEHGRVTFILDELGRVLLKNRKDDWSVAGTLRQYSANGRVRIIMTGFQSYFLRQMYDFEGPFVNFATTIRLLGFSRKEIEDFIIRPLSIWGKIEHKEFLLENIIQKIGRHPLYLQYFGSEIFEALFERNFESVDTIADYYLNQEGLIIFGDAVTENFLNLRNITERFLFLKKCQELVDEKQHLINSEINDDWIKEVLERCGFETTLDGRRFLLESLELHGLTEPIFENHSRQQIITPVIYNYLKFAEIDIKKLIKKFESELSIEKGRYTLSVESFNFE